MMKHCNTNALEKNARKETIQTLQGEEEQQPQQQQQQNEKRDERRRTKRAPKKPTNKQRLDKSTTSIDHIPGIPPMPPAGSPSDAARPFILSRMPLTLLPCASFIAAVSRDDSSSGPAAMASAVTSTALGAWLPVRTTRTVSSSS